MTYPLSATICHSETFSRGTIEKHLARLKAEIAIADQKLVSLNSEWVSCLEEEANLMVVPEINDDSRFKDEAGGLAAEIEAIVREGVANLERMDKVRTSNAKNLNITNKW
jgi:hypothetical protein